MSSATSHVDSYYAATANDDTRRPPLRGSARADICIVGGGYAGLSAALELAKRGYDVALLEAHRVGWGASGRNGGQMVTGFSPAMSKFRIWVGEEDARRLWRMAEEAKALLHERIRAYDIRCDLKSGYLLTALKKRHLRELSAYADDLSTHYGYDRMTMLDRDAVRAEVASDLYLGGLMDSGGGHLHPLNYALGLARAAKQEGAALYEDSAVEEIDETGDRITVRTAAGSVDTAHVVLCGNAYLGDLVPTIRRKIMPAGTYIIATEALPDERARALIPNDIAVADIKLALDYFRLSADRRLLFGGKVAYTALPPPGLTASMRRTMLKVFPQLADARIDYTWGGNVAITVERTPHLGRIGRNIYFAHGFSGHGVLLTGLAGKLIAEAVAGTAERFDLMAKLPHTTFAGGRLMRMPILALAMLYARVRDSF